MARQTYFGDRLVPEAEKENLVRGVFNSVASRYDLMNDLMSGGAHRWWKSALIDRLAPRPPMHLLDVAGGTGDIASRFLARVRPTAGAAESDAGDERSHARRARVTVCDINQAMLEQGRDKMIDAGVLRGIDWVCGNAEALPVADRSVDAYTIAFGIRNVTHIDTALREARRVLRPGGRFLCLEFSRVAVPALENLYDFYSEKVIPRLGSWIAGDRDSYAYLVESIRKFPDQRRFARMVEEAGFSRVDYRNLSAGIVAIHSAWRI